MNTISKNEKEYISENSVDFNGNSQRIRIIKITKEYSSKNDNINDNKPFNVTNQNIENLFMNNNYKRKKKIPPVPDFWGNIDDTFEPNVNKDVSNINNYINLNNKNDRAIKKKIYSNDINKIITITKYNNLFTNYNKFNSNFMQFNKNINTKIDDNDKHIDTKNDKKDTTIDVKPIINTKITINMNFYNILNENNENKSSINKFSNSTFKKDNDLNKFNKHNNKFIGKKEKLLRLNIQTKNKKVK